MTIRILAPGLVLCFVLGSCEKKRLSEAGKPGALYPESGVTVVWQVRVDSSTQVAAGREPLLWEDKVLWSNALSGKGFEIILSDGKSGSEIWRWQDFIKYPDLPFHNYHFVSGDYYGINNIQETHVINLRNGLTVWSYFDRNAGAYISEAGGYLFGKQNDRDFRPVSCSLRKTALASLEWETVLQLSAAGDSGFSPAIFGPALWINPAGDSILLFQNRSWNFQTGAGKVDLCAFDMSNDSMLFLLPDIEPSQNSNVLPPIVDGDRAYLTGQKNLHCIDLINQKVLWQKGFPGPGHHLMLSNLIIDGDILVVKPDNDLIYGFNKSSGELIWSTAQAGSSPSHMKLSEGVVWYVSEANGRVYGVNTEDGRLQHKIRSPNEGRPDCPAAAFHGGLAVNSKLGQIYVHDHHFFMAIKMR
jgi:hypothetical protein